MSPLAAPVTSPVPVPRRPRLSNDDFRKAIEAIKLRAPIEEVVRERVPGLRQRGALWEACCPFHEERTPSFKVDPRRGTWHCFGACSTGGDQIAFLQRIDNLDFRDALEILAARTGVELPRTSRANTGGDADASLYAALEHATNFYRSQMRTAEGQVAVRYLRERGLTDATCDAFGVGYSPASGQAFVTSAREARFDLAVCEKAGLSRRSDTGRPYDFFRGRLMIPIRDVKGRTVGFGARKLDDAAEGPKYINSADTEIFHKGKLVYALDRALPVVRREGRIVLVEGYTDVMAAHQFGVGSVVAVLGTATTEDHAGLIRKTGARRISLVFDGDEAGRKAAYKALHGLLHLEVEIDVVSLPGGDDPCDLLVREGSAAFLAQLDTAQGWFDFLLEGVRGLRGADLSREVDRVLELLARLSKPVHRDSRIAELAHALEIPVRSVQQQFESLPSQMAKRRRPTDGSALGAARGTAAAGSDLGSERAVSAPAAPVNPRVVRAFEEMIGAVLRDASTLALALPYVERCPDAELVRMFAALEELYRDESAVLDESSLLTILGEDPARARVVPIASRAVLVSDDVSPMQMVEEQKQFLDRLDREARSLRERRALQIRESQLMREEGAERAASDPELIDAARRLHGDSRAPSPSTPREVEDPIPHG